MRFFAIEQRHSALKSRFHVSEWLHSRVNSLTFMKALNIGWITSAHCLSPLMRRLRLIAPRIWAKAPPKELTDASDSSSYEVSMSNSLVRGSVSPSKCGWSSSLPLNDLCSSPNRLVQTDWVRARLSWLHSCWHHSPSTSSHSARSCDDWLVVFRVFLTLVLVLETFGRRRGGMIGNFCVLNVSSVAYPSSVSYPPHPPHPLFQLRSSNTYYWIAKMKSTTFSLQHFDISLCTAVEQFRTYPWHHHT